MIKELKPKTFSKRKELNLDLDVLKKAALVLRALNHKVRQQILLLIHKNGEITVSQIYAKLRLEQSVTSSHLAVLRKAGIVNTRREGQSIFYTVSYEHLSQIENGARQIIK